MNEERLQAIEERRKNADMLTVEDAVVSYPMHKSADAHFAEWVGEDVTLLIAEVRSLRAKLDAVPVAAINQLAMDAIDDAWSRKALRAVRSWLKTQAQQ